MSTNRNTQDLGIHPTSHHPTSQSIDRNTQLICPLGHILCSSVVREHSIRPLIVGLFYKSRPSHVTRLIRAPRVREPIKRMLWRGLRTDISKESNKGSTPFFTDSYVFIVSVSNKSRIRRTGKHISPRSILWSLLSIAQRAMFRHSLASSFDSQAAARPCIARNKRRSLNNLLISADTPAQPAMMPTCGIFNTTNNSQSTKNTTSKIKEIGHETPPIVFFLERCGNPLGNGWFGLQSLATGTV